MPFYSAGVKREKVKNMLVCQAVLLNCMKLCAKIELKEPQLHSYNRTTSYLIQRANSHFFSEFSNICIEKLLQNMKLV